MCIQTIAANTAAIEQPSAAADCRRQFHFCRTTQQRPNVRAPFQAANRAPHLVFDELQIDFINVMNNKVLVIEE